MTVMMGSGSILRMLSTDNEFAFAPRDKGRNSLEVPFLHNVTIMNERPNGLPYSVMITADHKLQDQSPGAFTFRNTTRNEGETEMTDLPGIPGLPHVSNWTVHPVRFDRSFQTLSVVQLLELYYGIHGICSPFQKRFLL